MFFLLFSLKGIYWYGYQVLKCFFSGILKKKSWGGIGFGWGGMGFMGGYSPPSPPCSRYNENPEVCDYLSASFLDAHEFS